MLKKTTTAPFPVSTLLSTFSSSPQHKPKTFFLFMLACLGLAKAEMRGPELFDAIKAGEARKIKAIIQAEPSLLKARDAKRWDRPTVLHSALRSDEMFDLLLSLGADIHATNGLGRPPIFLAQHDSNLLLKLLKKGAHVNARDGFGMSMLHYTATDSRRRAVSELLLQHGIDINGKSKHGMTPLHVASDPQIIKRLLENGADINAMDWRGRTPLFSARLNLAKLLVAAGAKTRIADLHGWTPLHEAAWFGNARKVEFLLKQPGQSIHATDDEGWTPLQAAARMNHRSVVEQLLAAGATPRTLDARGWSPADEARVRGFKELTRLLTANNNAPLVNQPPPARPKIKTEPGFKTAAGTLTPERPTLICLGFKWLISGDTNRNAMVAMAWRQKGDDAWRESYPALRIGGEKTGLGHVTPHMFAGSVIDLKPGTEYEVKLKMTDPDGVVGKAEHVLEMRTRSNPRPFPGGHKLHVYPAGHAGKKIAPGYSDIQSAYEVARPGDTILVHAGNHQKDLIINKKATAARPITIRGAGDGEARLQGKANSIVNVDGSSHHIFEDLTVYDADTAFLARGETQALTIRRCRFYQVIRPVFAISNRNKDFLISDCDMTGPVVDWHPRAMEKSQGVWITGQGHVASFNRIRKFWDGLSITGRVDVPPDLQNCAIDFYNNIMEEFLDDAIEMDYGVHNIRVFRNVIRNTLVGISTQPLEGGPGYIFRNVVYATTGDPLKLNQKPAGLFIFHNTLVSGGRAGQMTSGFQNARIYNNLFIGQSDEWVISGGTSSASTDIDYNGYRMFAHPGESRKPWRIHWTRLFPGYTPTGGGLSRDLGVRTLDEFAMYTHQRYGRHGLIVDFDEFQNCPRPKPKENQHDQSAIDLRLKPSARSRDKGKRLTYFSDGYESDAPDLGAYEFGAMIPHYGPRTKVADE